MEEKITNKGVKLETIEDCKEALKQVCWFLYIMAGLMAVIGLFLKSFWGLLPDIIFMSLGAFLLKKYESRSLSVVIFIYSIIICIITFANKFHLPFASGLGGTNVFLAVIFVSVAFRAVQAAFKLFKLNNYAVCWKNFAFKTAIFIAMTVILGFAGIVIGLLSQNDMILGALAMFSVFIAMFLAYAGIFPKSDKLKIKYVKEIAQECTD